VNLFAVHLFDDVLGSISLIGIITSHEGG
jgi:hypothetical protein